jgi:23S rRNA (adenine-N6)-dimethyltransferase
VTVVRADAATLRLPRLFAADLVLQRAVVRQYTGGLVRGAGRWLRTFEATNGMTLPRRAFAPPPRVDSSVLVLRRRGGPETLCADARG